MYLRFLGQQLKVVGMVIIGALIHPFILYPKREKIWEMRNLPIRERKWYWWFSDTTETGFADENKDYINSTWGLYELVKKRDEEGKWVPDYGRFSKYSSFRKWLVSYNWLVFRNGAWNYIASVFPPPIIGDDYECKINIGDKACSTWRNKTNIGKQFLVYPKDNPKYFRFSVTKVASWYNLHRLFAFIFSLGKWHTHFNFMVGHADNRHLIKMRSFTLEENKSKTPNKNINPQVNGTKHIEDY